MPFCPSCRQEFESFATTCPDCEEDLAAELAEETEVEVPTTTELHAADIDSAHGILELLKGAGVPVVPGDVTPDGNPILIVPSAFQRSVDALMESSPGISPIVGDPVTYRYSPPEPVEEAPLDLSVLEESVRQLAARGEEVIETLLEIVRRGEGDDRKKAVLAISAMGPVGRRALAIQAPILAREGSDQALYAVVSELRERQMTREDLAELESIAVAVGGDPETRIIALHALGRFPLPELAAPLLEVLTDDDPQVQEAADEALCNLLDDDVGFDSSASAEQQAAAILQWRQILDRRPPTR